jgi:DNA-binding SARP family transcriptional activator
MRQYRSLVRVLDRELAVQPLPETTRLYDDVRAGRLEPPPAPAAAAAPAPTPASVPSPAAGA